MNWYEGTEWVIHILIPLLLKEKNQKAFFDFWEVGEVRKAAIFYLRSHEKVVVSPELDGGRDKTHRVPSYDLDTPSDALEN